MHPLLQRHSRDTFIVHQVAQLAGERQ